MGENPLQELLNRLFWSSEIDKSEYEVIFRDSKARGGLRSVPFVHIYQIDRFGIDILGDDYIPLHKIVEIRKSGTVIWTK
jgi:uncharacterized protein (UPF0248 family)